MSYDVPDTSTGGGSGAHSGSAVVKLMVPDCSFPSAAAGGAKDTVTDALPAGTDMAAGTANGAAVVSVSFAVTLPVLARSSGTVGLVPTWRLPNASAGAPAVRMAPCAVWWSATTW